MSDNEIKSQMSQTVQDTTEKILDTDSINKPALESKKWVMSLIGLGTVVGTFLIATIMCAVVPSVAQYVSAMAGQVIVFCGALTGAYTVGQSFVDWKQYGTYAQTAQAATNVTNFHSDSETKTTKVDTVNVLEHIIEEGHPNAPEKRPFSSLPVRANDEYD